MDVLFHAPGSLLDYTFDWTSWLAGETLSASSWTVSAGLTQSNPSFGPTSTKVMLQGGVEGASYTLTNSVTASGGRQTSRSALIYSTVSEGAVPTLAEAKEGLNIRGSSSDSELDGWLSAAIGAVEGIVGPLRARLVTDNYLDDGGVSRQALYLRETPVIAVTSLAAFVGGQELYAGSLIYVEPRSGRLALRSGAPFSTWWGGYSVTYIVGRTEVPDEINKAIIIVLDHLWQTQRGWVSGSPTVRGELPPAPGGVPLPAGFALPNRAMELLAPYRRVAVG